MVSLWRNLPVTACPRDELWSVVQTTQDHRLVADLSCEPCGDAWGWRAFAPVWRVVVAFVIGNRPQANANLLLARGVPVTDDPLPVCTSEQCPADKNSVLHPAGQWDRPPRRGCRGRRPKPQRQPPPDLLYAQVVQKRDNGRIVAGGTRIVLGEPAAIAACLAASPVSQPLNPSFGERDTLTQRHHTRRRTRRTPGFSKDMTWFENQLWLSLADYHLGLPPESLPDPLPLLQPTPGAGSPRKWRPVTPARAAGITAHVWTMTELLSYRVPVQFLDRLQETEHLFPELD